MGSTAKRCAKRATMTITRPTASVSYALNSRFVSTSAGLRLGLYLVSGVSGKVPACLPRDGFNWVFGRDREFIFIPAPDGTVWWTVQVAAPEPPSDLAAIGLREVNWPSVARCINLRCWRPPPPFARRTWDTC